MNPFKSLLFWLVVTSGLAMIWPAERVGFDPFEVSGGLLWALIVLTMAALGTLVRPAELEPLRRRPWWVALGVATQVLVMPAAAWLATRILPISPELVAGVILVGCVPGAMASNVLTEAAGGSVAFSVSLTTVATLLSPVTVPAALWVLSDVNSPTSLLDPGQTSIALLMKVVVPVVVGYAAARRSGTIERVADRYASAVASAALLWIIASVVAGNRDRLVDVGGWLLLALLMVNAIGYAAGLGVGRLARLPDGFRRALTLEVGMQNAGLGTVMAGALYGAGTSAAIPTAAYTFGCMLTGTMLAAWWQRRPAGDRNRPPA
jgi:BASS family bile acid:Na+ symporter